MGTFPGLLTSSSRAKLDQTVCGVLQTHPSFYSEYAPALQSQLLASCRCLWPPTLVLVLEQNKVIFQGSNDSGGHGCSISQAKELRSFHTLLSHQRGDLAWHDPAQHGAIPERQFMMRRRGRRVIYSLICCGNGQRIITCKILINVLQQQTSFAKLVICCSAPDSQQLK